MNYYREQVKVLLSMIVRTFESIETILLFLIIYREKNLREHHMIMDNNGSTRLG